MSARLGPRGSRWLSTTVPGLLGAVAVALAARVLHRQLPAAVGDVLAEVVVAVGLGLLLAAVGVPERLQPGLRFAAATVLRAGIVLLGLQMVLGDILRLGTAMLGLITVLMVTALVIALSVARALRTPSRLATLVGIGVAVCGNSAIAAGAPTIGADQRETSQAIAVNTLFGTLALFVYPIVAEGLGITDVMFGAWAGTAINDTSQVVAAGFAYGDVSGEVATAVKLVRNVFMAPVLVILALVYARGARDRMSLRPGGLRSAVPGFVLAFVAAAALNSAGVVDVVAGAVAFPLRDAIAASSRLFILVALAGVGLSTPPDAFRRGGLRAVAVGFGTAATMAVLSLTLLLWLDPLGTR